MQETKNSSWYSTVAGALFAFGGVMELFQWLRILRFMSFLSLIHILLSMLNSCASGVSVVNIDNGFGAGYLANMINHMEVKR